MEYNVVLVSPTCGMPVMLKPLMALIRRAVGQTDEIVHYHIVYLPGLGVTKRINRSYHDVERQLQAITRSGPMILIGYSQGSAHAVQFAARNPEAVLGVIDVAGVHRGSWLASMLPVLPGAYSMRPGSPALRDFAAVVDACGDLPPVYSYAGRGDRFVRFGCPVDGCVRHEYATGHLGIFFQSGMLQQLAAEVRQHLHEAAACIPSIPSAAVTPAAS